ncbi:hypothetical protein NECAME_00010 [Necator americanus]|uniref:Uncharacterized protein n=1 Tax=Necator americanus TaxID=51031 RepID=W2U1A3_NECAM|nr:hypothetical protein NECAME_00010 [Necator americanus]ETN87151.1 hypothetical protein NECAME_00010 [Necator americanus]
MEELLLIQLISLFCFVDISIATLSFNCGICQQSCYSSCSTGSCNCPKTCAPFCSSTQMQVTCRNVTFVNRAVMLPVNPGAVTVNSHAHTYVELHSVRLVTKHVKPVAYQAAVIVNKLAHLSV